MLTQAGTRVEAWARLLYALLTGLLSWRPTTLLAYLVAVAVAGILVAVALIFGVRFHLLHRLL